ILQQQINEVQALLSQREETVIANEEYNEKEKYAASSLSDEKKKNLFLSLEKLMREEKLFKDNFLTKEKVADKLNTNRTYLSQVINEQKGETFTQYINNYRINEAVKVLSDNTIQIPLKALSSELGFNSMTTFYKLFQNHIGMTPTQYKEKARKI
ncbi:MAG: helix-turn-helix domain-containing protein, partial [Phocaeicola sp.]